MSAAAGDPGLPRPAYETGGAAGMESLGHDTPTPEAE